MLRSSIDKEIVLSMASLNSLSRKDSLSRRVFSINKRSSKAFDQLPNLMQQNELTPLVKFKTRQKQKPNYSQIYQVDQPLLNKKLKQAKEELQEIKMQIKRQRSYTEDPTDQKLIHCISILRDSVDQRQSQPIYYPIPMPFPYIMQGQYSMPTIQSSPALRYPQINSSQVTATRPNKSDTSKQKELKALRIKKIFTKWRKAVNSVIFIVYLKQFCKKVQASRRILFEKFALKYSHQFKKLVKYLREKMHPLFRILSLKKQIKFEVEEDDKMDIVKEKVTLIKGIIKMILEGLNITFTSNQEELTKFFYFVCRHGNFTCTKPLLTEEELQLSCISSEFKYVSADCNLQKSAILNFFIIKTLIFNIFLSPFQLSQNRDSPLVIENLILISTVLYELVIDVQDEYLIRVPKSYQIGNFDSFEFVKNDKSMIMEGAQHKPGELISGLRSQKEVKKYFRLYDWGQQKKIIKILINSVAHAMKIFHAKLIQRHF